MALTHSPLQHFFNVLCYKNTLEETKGPMTSSELASCYASIVFANPEEAATWLKSWNNLEDTSLRILNGKSFFLEFVPVTS